MTRLLRFLFSASLLLVIVAPDMVFAAGDAAPMTMKDILWDLGIKVLNVGILAFFGFKYLSKPLNDFVALRAEKIRDELDEAQRARREAEERLSQFKEKAAGIDAEIEELRQKTCSDIDHEQKILLEEARQAAEHIRTHARDTIHLEVSKAKADLHTEAVRLAGEIAEDLILRNVSPEDQKRLFSEYVKEMEAAR